MPAEATKRFSSQRLRITAEGWEAEESWDVIGASSKPEAIAAAVAHNAAHPDNVRLRVEERDAESVGNGLYVVRAVYRDGDFGEAPDDPLLQPYEIEWDFAEETKAIERDRDGNPIVNSAGDPFDPPPPGDDQITSLIVYRNEPFFSVATAKAYMRRVNADAFTVAGAGGFNAGQVLCRSIKPQGRYGPLSPFVPVVYRFEFKDETKEGTADTEPWQLHIRDQGLNGWHNPASGGTHKGRVVYRPDTTNSVEIEPVPFAVRLDGEGKPIESSFRVGDRANSPVNNPTLPTGLVVAAESTADGVYLLWRNRKTANFADFGF